MAIIHRYLLKETLRNLFLCSLGLSVLFLVFDFFDRIDNILREDTSFWVIIKYFLFKIPPLFNLTLPLAMLGATLLTIGIISKNSELTAMRASGMTIFWIARPLFLVSLGLSVLSIALNETVVPYCSRRVREIYNIDIREKHKTGRYSQSDFWWRDGDNFYAANMFDSRNNTLLQFSQFTLDNNFQVASRTDAQQVKWVNPLFGWSMEEVTQRAFEDGTVTASQKLRSLTFPISEKPKDFYDAKTDPHTMSYLQLKRFIKKQVKNGVSTANYLADLYAKIAFPFVIFIVTLTMLPFAITPARSKSMASSVLAGLVLGFTYYVVHSLSLALGRAELWYPIAAAWMANFLMGSIGVILNLGAEAPE